jgi:hypothetical protein
LKELPRRICVFWIEGSHIKCAIAYPNLGFRVVVDGKGATDHSEEEWREARFLLSTGGNNLAHLGSGDTNAGDARLGPLVRHSLEEEGIGVRLCLWQVAEEKSATKEETNQQEHEKYVSHAEGR